MSSVQFQAVTKSYDGKHQVIKPLNITINDGEFMVMVGPSGCGKSTLLRMVAGLEQVTSGEIWINQHCVTKLEPSARGVAMVFQNYALYPHMSVAQNMGYGLKIRGMSQSQVEKRVLNTAKTLELDMVLNRFPRELSGGQRQRVAMGRAIVREPAVFLFDEPLSNLDARLRVQMRLELQQLHRRLKTTSLYVTHDQVEAMTLAERVMVMNQGTVEQIATPSEIYQRPASTFVASFMGAPAMNLLPGKISSNGREFLIGHNIAVSLPQPRTDLANRLVTLGIRPEDIHLSATETSQLAVKIESLEMLGADNLLHGCIAELPLIVRSPANLSPAIGQVLSLFFEERDMHLFDTQTGLRIDGY